MDLEIVWDFIFPARCISCRKYPEGRAPLCAECAAKIPINQTFFCGVCSARLPEGKRVCHKDAQFILGGASSYENDAVRDLIHALKFQGIKHAAVSLGNLVISYLNPLLQEEVLVVPVPLGKKRLNLRGFNQAELIARTVSEKLSLPLALALTRTKETKPQSGLRDNKLRNENVLDCFAAAPGTDFKGKTILLIDDVTTTHATFREAAKVLKFAGARKVYAVAAAKA